MKKIKYLFTCLLCAIGMAAQAQESQLEYHPMAQ